MHRLSLQGDYDSYLLRLWRANPQAPWQASLQSTATGEIHQFGDVESLWAFVMARLDVDSAQPPREDG
jgi:hypothetical protein